MTLRAVHEYMGFVPWIHSKSDTEVPFVEDTIVTAARWDDYLAKVVTCFRDDGTDKEGGHWQKLYCNTFPSFLQRPTMSSLVALESLI